MKLFTSSLGINCARISLAAHSNFTVQQARAQLCDPSGGDCMMSPDQVHVQGFLCHSFRLFVKILRTRLGGEPAIDNASEGGLCLAVSLVQRVPTKRSLLLYAERLSLIIWSNMSASFSIPQFGNMIVCGLPLHHTTLCQIRCRTMSTACALSTLQISAWRLTILRRPRKMPQSNGVENVQLSMDGKTVQSQAR